MAVVLSSVLGAAGLMRDRLLPLRTTTVGAAGWFSSVRPTTGSSVPRVPTAVATPPVASDTLYRRVTPPTRSAANPVLLRASMSKPLAASQATPSGVGLVRVPLLGGFCRVRVPVAQSMLNNCVVVAPAKALV